MRKKYVAFSAAEINLFLNSAPPGMDTLPPEGVIPLSFLFTDIHLTANLLCGAAIIFSGMFLVIGNPRDMLNLRNVC